MLPELIDIEHIDSYFWANNTDFAVRLKSYKYFLMNYEASYQVHGLGSKKAHYTGFLGSHATQT